jgi:two-component system sensor histidine kinase UhpB
LFGHAQTQNLVIEADPADEIREAWEEVRTTTIHNLIGRECYAEIPPQLNAIDTTVAQLQNRVRVILWRLRPLALDELGLEKALHDLVVTWQTRCPQVKWSLETHCLNDTLDDILQVTIYRIIQECLTNIAWHAEAHNAWVRLVAHGEVARDAGHVDIQVEDDGQGMSPGTQFGLGLTGIQERVRALGGRLTVTSHNGGVRVHAAIPIIHEPAS